MIGDYNRGDETVLAAALEVFDLLSNTLAEYQTAMSPRAGATPTPTPDMPSTGKPYFLSNHHCNVVSASWSLQDHKSPSISSSDFCKPAMGTCI